VKSLTENAIVQWRQHLDEWGHQVPLAVVKSMAEAIVARRIRNPKLEKNLITQFLNRHPSLATKFSSRLDTQRALGSDSVVLKDYFTKVRFPYFINDRITTS